MICLDSTVIIDFLKGREEAINIIGIYMNDGLATTELTIFEIFAGIYLKKSISENEVIKATEFFNSINVLSFDKTCGEKAARIYAFLSNSGNLIEQNDVFISAIMIKNGCEKIITRNEKHFLKIDGIKVVRY
ncbi:MAG: type II toxin-antitoxin system VapC family toxin [Nanoarchaeota archaeon]